MAEFTMQAVEKAVEKGVEKAVEKAVKAAEKVVEKAVKAVRTEVRPIISQLEDIKSGIKDLQIRASIMEAKQENSCARIGDPLKPVPLPDGTSPPLFPQNLGMLVIGGSELTPGTDVVSSWNMDKSLQLIKLYDPGYESENEAKTPGAKKASLRRRHLHLAKLIGATPSQIMSGVMELVL